MGHTYGTWLPGDPRGFRTRHHREHVDGDYKNPPPRGRYEGLHAHAAKLMKRQPVLLTLGQRGLVLRLLVESLWRRKLEVVIASLTDVHFHLLARFPDRDPRHWVGIAKRESSYFARQQGAGREGGLWTARGKDLPIVDRRHQLSTARYIHDHLYEGGGVWYRNDVLIPKTRDISTSPRSLLRGTS